jgi:hypothetical protein
LLQTQKNYCLDVAGDMVQDVGRQYCLQTASGSVSYSAGDQIKLIAQKKILVDAGKEMSWRISHQASLNASQNLLMQGAVTFNADSVKFSANQFLIRQSASLRLATVDAAASMHLAADGVIDFRAAVIELNAPNIFFAGQVNPNVF